MNDNIAKLEEQLRLEKIKEAKQRILNNYNQVKNTYEGKCFANVSFKRKLKYYKTNYYYIQYISEVILFDNSRNHKLKITELDQYLETYPNNIDSIVPAFYEERVSINSGNYFLQEGNGTGVSLLNFGFEDIGKYEIKKDKFDKIKFEIEQAFKRAEKSFDNANPPIDYLNTKDYLEQLEKCGAPLVTLTQSEAYCLETNNFPFIYGDKVLKSDLSVKIVETYLTEEKRRDSLDTGFYCNGEYIPPSGLHKTQIERLQSILNKLKI